MTQTRQGDGKTLRNRGAHEEHTRSTRGAHEEHTRSTRGTLEGPSQPPPSIRRSGGSATRSHRARAKGGASARGRRVGSYGCQRLAAAGRGCREPLKVSRLAPTNPRAGPTVADREPSRFAAAPTTPRHAGFPRIHACSYALRTRTVRGPSPSSMRPCTYTGRCFIGLIVAPGYPTLGRFLL